MQTRGAASDIGDEKSLPAIPYFEVDGPLDLLTRVPAATVADLVAAGRDHYGALPMRVGEWLSQRWLARSTSPYRHEVQEVTARLSMSGGALLNLSYEWSCSSAAAADPEGGGNRLLRTLDWPLPGLGRHVVVARHDGPAGPWYNVTWPGFVGVLTAMAPGRFSVAINQPPMRRFTPAFAVDWLCNRIKVWQSHAMPPSHLLRLVCETAHDYRQAKTLLQTQPICIPAFFILSGLHAHEGCIVERLETAAAVHEDQPACMTNHWRGFTIPSRLRGEDTHARLAQLVAVANGNSRGFAWVQPPILNPATRLATVANALRRTLSVQGFEAGGAATRPFSLPEPRPAETQGTKSTRQAESPAP
jgi:hypothetical protein